MKPFLWIVLFASLGLNAGLVWRVISERDKAGQTVRAADPAVLERSESFGARPWRRPSQAVLADSSRWSEMAQHRLDRLAQRLGLEGEQRRRFTAVHLQAATEIRRQRLAVSEARRELYRIYTASEIDRDAVAAAVAELTVRQGRLDALVAEVLSEELALLDRGQRERYLALMPWEVGGERPEAKHRGRERPPRWRHDPEPRHGRGHGERDTIGP